MQLPRMQRAKGKEWQAGEQQEHSELCARSSQHWLLLVITMISRVTRPLWQWLLTPVTCTAQLSSFCHHQALCAQPDTSSGSLQWGPAITLGRCKEGCVLWTKCMGRFTEIHLLKSWLNLKWSIPRGNFMSCLILYLTNCHGFLTIRFSHSIN